jgi:ribonuclease HI
LAAEDSEPGTCASRLELLAVVRGLEALDQPSRVTLVTRSRYVARGIRRGLTQWRARRWRWERFGQLVPIRDHDLWQRIDQAMRIHDVDCCGWNAEALDSSEAADTAQVELPSVAAAMVDSAGEPDSSETARETKVAACEATDRTIGPALVIVERIHRRSPNASRARNTLLNRAADTLRQTVLAPLAAFCRPAFTRAA